MNYEIAVGTPANRHKLIPQAEVSTFLFKEGLEQSLYVSVYCYDPADYDKMVGLKAKEWGHIQRYIEWVPIDIDKGNNSDEETIKIASNVLRVLMTEFGLRHENIKTYFSGNGYHILIHGDCFGFNNIVKSKIDGVYDLPFCVKQTMTSLPFIGNLVDSSIYQLNGLLRGSYSLNLKSARYKIPVTIDEIMSEDYHTIHHMSKSGRRLDFKWDTYSGDGEMEQYVSNVLPDIRNYDDKTKDSTKYRACISHILNTGPVKGQRNHDIMVLASAFMQIGMPLLNAKKVILDWNNNSLDVAVVNQQIEYTYNREYTYGCSHKFLAPHCSPRCKHYQNKDITTSLVDNEKVLQEAYLMNMKEIRANGIDMGMVLGYSDSDNAFSSFILTPNDSVIVLTGPTKSGKSTFMKHLVLGIGMGTSGLLMPKQRRKTLYYTGEQSPAHWVNHCAQILADVTKEEFEENQYEILKQYGRYITEMVLPHSPVEKPSGWEQHIKDGGYELVVIDTMDHALVNSSNEHAEKLAMLQEAQRLNGLYGTIFWFVSQIKREDAKIGKTTLFSGKGSGAIENQARKVIGLENYPDIPNQKTLRILADTYGLPGVEIQYQLCKTGRLRRI